MRVWFLASLLVGCVEATGTNEPTDSSEPTPSDPSCPAAQSYEWPGCEPPSGAVIEPGCYQSCSGESDGSCTGDTTCTQAWTNPCVCGKGEDCCMACGSEAWLCL